MPVVDSPSPSPSHSHPRTRDRDRSRRSSSISPPQLSPSFSSSPSPSRSRSPPLAPAPSKFERFRRVIDSFRSTRGSSKAHGSDMDMDVATPQMHMRGGGGGGGGGRLAATSTSTSTSAAALETGTETAPHTNGKHSRHLSYHSSPLHRSYSLGWKFFVALIIGICIGATIVIVLHQTPKAGEMWRPFHLEYSRHISHYHPHITAQGQGQGQGQGREQMLTDDKQTDTIQGREEKQALILNEIESVCGKMMVTHNQWYVLNHDLHPEPVSEAEAIEAGNRTTGSPKGIAKFRHAVSFLRFWGNAYYHGALQVLPFVNVMAKRLKNDLHHLTYLSTIQRSQESIASWLGFNHSLIVSWPPRAFYVEKLYHMDMVQDGNLNMACVLSFRADLWRRFAHPHHYEPDNQYIVLANRLGSRGITNFDALVRHLRQEFPDEKFVRQYGDEQMEDIRDTYMHAKAVIYPHGANSANIHMFAPPHRQFTSGFHIGNAAHRLYPMCVIEITWMLMNGNVWRNVQWELGQAGHEYHSVRVNASSVLLPALLSNTSIPSVDQFLHKHSKFLLEKDHFDQITTILKNYLKQRKQINHPP